MNYESFELFHQQLAFPANFSGGEELLCKMTSRAQHNEAPNQGDKTGLFLTWQKTQ